MNEIDAHPEMPKDLKHHIRQTWEENCANGTIEIQQRCPQLNMIWLHCDGGFPAYFYPYYNQLGYLQPIVMVQLKNPTPGVLVNIQCTAWAKFIEHDTQKMRGSIHIEFLMD
jgi:hypothetical protein